MYGVVVDVVDAVAYVGVSLVDDVETEYTIFLVVVACVVVDVDEVGII